MLGVMVTLTISLETKAVKHEHQDAVPAPQGVAILRPRGDRWCQGVRLFPANRVERRIGQIGVAVTVEVSAYGHRPQLASSASRSRMPTVPPFDRMSMSNTA